MNVLSLFDGMSCGQLALNKIGIKPDKYFASEIDKHAIKVMQSNFPDTIQIGDVKEVSALSLPKIDLLIGGSPCQGFSLAGSGLNFKDPRSKLFFEYLRILREVRHKNPKALFLLENVRMKPKIQDIISKHLEIDPIKINSSLLSAQNRVRLYWTNIPNVEIPEDRGIKLKDILEDLPDCPIGIRVREKSNCLRVGGKSSPFGSKQIWDSPFQKISKNEKVKPSIEKPSCLTGGGNSGGNHSDMDLIHSEISTRRYSVTECERLQTVPDGYTKSVSKSQAYKMLGNGWTVDVIAHIFKNIEL